MVINKGVYYINQNYFWTSCHDDLILSWLVFCFRNSAHPHESFLCIFFSDLQSLRGMSNPNNCFLVLTTLSYLLSISNRLLDKPLTTETTWFLSVSWTWFAVSGESLNEPTYKSLVFWRFLEKTMPTLRSTVIGFQ